MCGFRNMSDRVSDTIFLMDAQVKNQQGRKPKQE